MSVIVDGKRVDGVVSGTANTDLSNLTATGKEKFSKVSVSETGSSTEVANYITIDGVEKQLPGVSDLDYNNLTNKPTLNTVEIKGNKDSYDYNIVWKGTQAEYDALTTKIPGCIYCVEDDNEPTTSSYYTKTEVDTLLTDKQDVSNLVTNFSASPEDTKYPSEKLVKENLDTKQETSNMVITWQATPDDQHYPSEKLVKDNLGNKVSVSATGTTTDEIGYITVDGVEKKLPSYTLQEIYDLMHPIDELYIGFSAPTVPTGVVASWEVDSDYDGKSLWIDSTQTAGTELEGSLPNIQGYLNSPYIVASKTTGYNGAISAYQTVTTGYYPTQGATTDYGTGIKLNASNSNTVYSASAGTNVVRPTSIVVHVYKRVS